MILQKVELKVKRVAHVGTCDNSAGNYPLAKKKMTMEVWQKTPGCSLHCVMHAPCSHVSVRQDAHRGTLHLCAKLVLRCTASSGVSRSSE